MDELRLVTILASPEGCDRVADLADAHRISPTEVMVLGEASIEVLGRVVRGVDPDAVVLEVSDAWTRIALHGPGAREALARWSELELPAEGFVQGEVARVGARVLVHERGVDLLVPASVEAHVRGLVRADREGSMP